MNLFSTDILYRHSTFSSNAHTLNGLTSKIAQFFKNIFRSTHHVKNCLLEIDFPNFVAQIMGFVVILNMSTNFKYLKLWILRKKFSDNYLIIKMGIFQKCIFFQIYQKIHLKLQMKSISGFHREFALLGGVDFERIADWISSYILIFQNRTPPEPDFQNQDNIHLPAAQGQGN